jgi:hypothetical protein
VPRDTTRVPGGRRPKAREARPESLGGHDAIGDGIRSLVRTMPCDGPGVLQAAGPQPLVALEPLVSLRSANAEALAKAREVAARVLLDRRNESNSLVHGADRFPRHGAWPPWPASEPLHDPSPEWLNQCHQGTRSKVSPGHPVCTKRSGLANKRSGQQAEVVAGFEWPRACVKVRLARNVASLRHRAKGSGVRPHERLVDDAHCCRMQVGVQRELQLPVADRGTWMVPKYGTRSVLLPDEQLVPWMVLGASRR